jgi:molecular chaperone GrpE
MSAYEDEALVEEDAHKEEAHDSEQCFRDLQELEAKWKRALADLSNQERTSQRAREEQAKFAAAGVLRDFLAFGDALDAATSTSKDCDVLVKMFEEVLARHGVTPIVAEHVVDYTMHEIVGERKVPDAVAGTILDVAQRGYQLHDRCLRPTKVIVAADQGK